ncbi:MAG: prephenate dehydrogenase/arogenate dehydrogenase family protein [Caulobacterales bacterium]|nr:prephenate dehydrogenase/arogenate dehydrogenase family protein [Caulobacterales bacterium]
MTAAAPSPPAEAFLVAGCGLIGSSLARAARAKGLARRVLVLDRDPSVVDRALSLGLADAAATSLDALDARPDLAALCAPPRALAGLGAELMAALDERAVLFDVGSVKGELAEAVLAARAPGAPDFVPAHPIAGTEQSGPEAGFAELFEDRWCVLTPVEGAAAPASVERVAAFWRGCGAHVTRMTPSAHDALLAATSHVPHLIAYALTLTAADDAGVPRDDMARYSAGGFRDFTRIAASDPVMWRDVFLANRTEVLAALDRFEQRLAMLRAAVDAGDGAALADSFERTRAVRARIIDAGQETAEADFGRPRGHGES